ncbi:hypothetical protein [Thermosediminibacter litoriperuensis]|uniref:Uncharacterized protein n=1 Tax=Thermosediminibacter litoriperuensis TaxID=291989 RepID=A0A5S5ABG4_9FIRM|nr:hypothetical protein [Thermosediminibacter litoriperuensis]TYP46775.1 hypothetical protein LZ11_02490 [Thermosediminibacter litoriperuensis]
MADQWFEKWQKQRHKEIEKFIDGWNWHTIFITWKSRMRDYPVSLNPLFTEIWVHDPEYPTGRKNALSWWIANEINELHINFQRHLDRFPGTIGPINPCNCRQGELMTLNYLWKYKENEEKIAAILISASLFTRLYSSRKQYPQDYWPPYYCVEELFKWAYKTWNDEEGFSAWQHYHTEVLPYKNNDYVFKLHDINALVHYLADEHALVFLNYKPVSIEFKEKRYPYIQKIK